MIDTDTFGAMWYKWMYYPTYNRLDGLLIGVGIAAITCYTEWPRRAIANYPVPFLLAGFGVLIADYMLCAIPTSFAASIAGFPLVALGFGLIVAPCAARQSFINRYPSRITAMIAELSYAIYLTHKAAIHIAQAIAVKLDLDTAGTTVFLLSLLVSLLAATALYYIIERPFLRFKERILRRKWRAYRLSV